jgi:hypothetical protein
MKRFPWGAGFHSGVWICFGLQGLAEKQLHRPELAGPFLLFFGIITTVSLMTAIFVTREKT